MSDCCETNEPKATGGCECTEGKTVLLYACSGGANVGEISDLAARELMFDGAGTMFCQAGLGGDIQGMIQTAKDADVNLLIDGCPMDCVKMVFDRCGVSNYRQIKVTDCDIEKVKGVRCTSEQVEKVVSAAKNALCE